MEEGTATTYREELTSERPSEKRSAMEEMHDAVKSDKEKVVELSKRMLKMFSGHKAAVISAAIKVVEKEIGSESVYSYKFDK